MTLLRRLFRRPRRLAVYSDLQLRLMAAGMAQVNGR